MAEIVLSTLNAKYIHAAFGLRYLLANLGPLQSKACLVEFDINQRPLDIVEILLAQEPRIIGLGVYIWNVTPTTELVAAIKRVRPDVTIILGGPEVSYETETQPIRAALVWNLRWRRSRRAYVAKSSSSTASTTIQVWRWQFRRS